MLTLSASVTGRVNSTAAHAMRNTSHIFGASPHAPVPRAVLSVFVMCGSCAVRFADTVLACGSSRAHRSRRAPCLRSANPLPPRAVLLLLLLLLLLLPLLLRPALMAGTRGHRGRGGRRRADTAAQVRVTWPGRHLREAPPPRAPPR